MTKLLRNILITGTALSLPFVAVASPAGASTPRPKFINAIHQMAPATQQVNDKVLLALGNQICYEINAYAETFTPSAQQVLIVADALKGYDVDAGNPVTHNHLGLFLVDSVVYLCPSYDSALQGFQAWPGDPAASLGIGTVDSSLVPPAAPPTTTTTLPSTATSYTPSGWVGTSQDDLIWSQMGQFFPGDQVDPDSVYYMTDNVDVAGVDLEKAMSPGQIQYLFQNSGIPPAVASGMIVEAAAWLCPNYRVEADTWYNASSGEPPLNISGNTAIQSNSDPPITGPGGNSGTSGTSGKKSPSPKPKYIGNAEAAYKDGDINGSSGGGFFQYGSLSGDCQKAYAENQTNGVGVPIFGTTGAIVGHIANSPTIRTNWVAGCIAGVESNNNNGLGYNKTPTTTTTSTSAPSGDGYTDAEVCADFSQNQTGDEVVNEVSADTGSWGPAYQFVVAAVQSTCPQYTSAVDAITHG